MPSILPNPSPSVYAICPKCGERPEKSVEKPDERAPDIIDGFYTHGNHAWSMRWVA